LVRDGGGGKKEVERYRKKLISLFFVFRWIFEKYDGLRGLWNPEKQAMYSRVGTKFNLPQYIIDDMPKDIFLDGELWYIRDFTSSFS